MQGSRGKSVARIVNGVIGGAICVLLAYAIYKYWDEFRILTTISPSLAIVVLFFGFVWNTTLALILRAALKPFHVHMGVVECIGVNYAACFCNIFVPLSNVGVRGLYLKRVHNLGLNVFAVAMVGPVVIELFVYAMGGLFALLLLSHQTELTNLLKLFFLVVIAAAIAAIFVPSAKLPLWLPFRDRVLGFIGDWKKLSSNGRVLAEIVVLTVINFIAAAALYSVAANAAAVSSDGVASTVVAALSEFSYVIRVTPAGLGTFEGSVAVAGQIVGYTLAQSLVVATLVRLTSVFWYLLLGPLYWRQLIRPRDDSARVDLA